MRYFYIRKCLSEINAPPMIGYLFIFPGLKTWQLTSTQRNEWKQHTTNLKRRICLGWKLRTLTCDFHSWNRCWRKTGWSPQKILWTSARQLFNVNAIVQLPGHQKRKKYVCQFLELPYAWVFLMHEGFGPVAAVLKIFKVLSFVKCCSFSLAYFQRRNW